MKPTHSFAIVPLDLAGRTMRFSEVEVEWLLYRARQISQRAGLPPPLARSQAIIELSRLRAEPKVVLFGGRGQNRRTRP